MNPTRFSNELGFPNPENIRRLSKEPEAKPGLPVLQAILKRFPEISALWLVTGEETMFRAGYIRHRQIALEKENDQGLLEKLLESREEVGILKGENSCLRDEVAYLRSKNMGESIPSSRTG